jgi:hypothetical protein
MVVLVVNVYGVLAFEVESQPLCRKELLGSSTVSVRRLGSGSAVRPTVPRSSAKRFPSCPEL